MKETFKRKKLTKMLSLTLALAMVLTMMPWMSVPVRAEGGDLVAKKEASSYTPTTIINGDFSQEPWMNYKINNTVYNSVNNKYSHEGHVEIQESYPNSIGWNTSEKYLQGGTLFEHLGGLANWHNDELHKNMHGYCVEMNSAKAAVLYQDLTTYPGDIIQWTLNHGFRTIPSNEVADVQSIKVEIGKPESRPEGIDAKIVNDNTMSIYSATAKNLGDYGYANPNDLTGLSISKGNGTGVWHHAQGVYIVPEGQAVTRFAFISENTKTPDMGNYLDDVTFSTLVGNLHAVALDDGNVKVTGYWGDKDKSKKLEIKIDENTVINVDMSAVSDKNFSVIIPAGKIGASNSVSIYHQDYPTATESVNIESHTHNWTYETGTGVDANKLIAKCEGDGFCSVENGKTGLPLTIFAKTVASNDENTTPTVSYGTKEEQEAWEAAGLTPPNSSKSMKYYKANPDGTKDGEALGEVPPKAVGKYIVDVEVPYNNGTDTKTFSVPYSIKSGDAPDAPTIEENQVHAPTYPGASDGKITGVNDNMEYSIDDGVTWISVPIGQTEITGLPAGKVLVRLKETDDTVAGSPTEVTIPEGTIPEEFSEVKINPATGDDTSDGEITGVDDTMEYRIVGDDEDTGDKESAADADDTKWTPVTGDKINNLPAGTVVKIRTIATPAKMIKLTIGTRIVPSNNDGSGHVHEFEWGNWDPVTKDENGIRVYQCKLCGYLLEKEYIPAYAYTCLTESEHVLKTPQNGSVICEMGRWNAYPRWFFEKLATRPDVNITLKFLYQHKQYTVYIPAGTKIDTEHDWYGPMKICSLYQFEVK